MREASFGVAGGARLPELWFGYVADGGATLGVQSIVSGFG